MSGRYQSIYKEECKKRKPYPIKKLQARFQRANLIKFCKERIALGGFLIDVDEDGFYKTIQDCSLKTNLPEKIKTQIKYIRVEIEQLKRMIEKEVPEYGEDESFPYRYKYNLEQLLNQTKP